MKTGAAIVLIAALHGLVSIPSVNHHDQIQSENPIGGTFPAISGNVNAPLWLVLKHQ
jgi:hypothetical protein